MQAGMISDAGMHLPRCQSLQFGLRMSGRLPFFIRWHILYFGQYQTRQHRTEQNKTQTGLIAGAGICITHALPDYPYFAARAREISPPHSLFPFPKIKFITKTEMK
jgi:hypothetical protein